ncbi:BatD family protein [Dyella sp.]|uniref:BatD family protein n=1 Tax=Dyella sp. TaxID=1869338 RepID=UPI002ED6BE30
MKSIMRIAWLWMLLVVTMPAWAVDVQASLDRSNVHLGETVTLNLVARGVNTTHPIDLGVLSEDFDVLNSSSSVREVNINGKQDSAVLIGIVLRPKHAGTLTIPSLQMAGGSTQPVQLQVSAQPAIANVPGQSDVYLDAKIEPAQGYVGQQFQYVLRVYYTGMLAQGVSLGQPQADGASFMQLDNEADYESSQNGRTYHVAELRYAMFPDKPGKLTIGPVHFQGDLIDPDDPTAFIGRARTVNASSSAVTVDVKDIPAGQDRKGWLPVRNLSLTADGLPADGQTLQQGKPVTFTMLLAATGAPYDALPAPGLPAIEGASVYPDKPVNGTRSDGGAVVGRRQQSFAIIPNRPGTLVIPEITVHWWNVATNQPEVARLPERRFTVVAAPGQPPAPAVSSSTAVPATTASTAVAASGSHDTALWRALAIIGFVLWLVTLVAAVVFYRRRRVLASGVGAAPVVDRPSVAVLKQAFMEAARGTDVRRQAATLMAWARAERPAIQNLGQLSAALHKVEQRQAIAAMQQQLYAARSALGAPDLAQAFSTGLAWVQPTEGEPAGGELPPLYPFDVQADRKDPF